jgi:hypothetical protein
MVDIKTKANTYTPPKAAQNNAKRMLKWREEHSDDIKGGTNVGWIRANQLASGEAISEDIVKRMAQFNRHRENATVNPKYKDEPWRDAGYVAWNLWGGTEGVNWAMSQSKRIQKADIISEEKRYIKATVYESSLYKEDETNRWIAVCNKSDCETPFYLDESHECPKCGELAGDMDGEAMTADDVEKACWMYLEGIQQKLNKKSESLNEASQIIKSLAKGEEKVDITKWVQLQDLNKSQDKYHIGIVHQIFDKSTGVIVENYCEHKEIELFGKTYTKTEWKIGQILNEELFELAKSGELIGFSFHGAGYTQDIT